MLRLTHKNIDKILKYSVVFLIWVVSCTPKSKQSSEEKAVEKDKIQKLELGEPIEIINLPKALKEISGLSIDNNGNIVCVNDEKAKIYLYNAQKQEIVKDIDFGKSGDFEAIEYVNGDYYILESGGRLTKYNEKTDTKEIFDVSQPNVKEYEGMAYDPQKNALLLAAKEGKDGGKLFWYDIKTQNIELLIDLAAIDWRKNKEGNIIKPSGLAIQNEEIFIIASAGKKMVVLNHKTMEITQYNLDSDLLPQPEGVAVLGNKLYISTEAASMSQAKLVIFNR